MRYVEAVSEARLLAGVNGVSAVVSIALGVAVGTRDDWWILPGAAALFAALGLWDARKVSSGPLVHDAFVERTAVTLRLGLPVAVFVPLLTLVVEDPLLGAMVLGVALGFLARLVKASRLEKRTGYRILRQLGLGEPRFALALKDTAAAQRNLAHAQSEAS